MAPLRFDIACRVVDNFGDAGVCWRLARQLAAEHAIAVRLWIDDPGTLARIVPGLDRDALAQHHAGVDVHRLAGDLPAQPLPDALIAGFGCAIPASWLDAFAAAASPPVYVSLEYLSAEPWVDDLHGLPSPHPTLPLARWVYFPGFTPASGGLLRERGLPEARDAFLRDQDSLARERGSGRWPTARGEVVVSLFCYANEALPALLEAWAREAAPVRAIVPEGIATAALQRFAPAWTPQAGATLVRGTLALAVVPFTDQDGFDRRLWSCDLDIVRGEDSFVRAQWAARPLVWHAYPQAGRAHEAKLDAFLTRYLAGADPSTAAALAEFTRAFNGEDGTATVGAWPALRAALPTLRRRAADWAHTLGAQSDLASRLVGFIRKRL
jgi:uncharacterized repeat protein (TIGR03837 family)